MTAPWRYVYASVVGSSHTATGAPCQDCSLVTIHPALTGDLLIMVAADGAGSARCSDVGASLACSQLSMCLIEYAEQNGSLIGATSATALEWTSRILELLEIKAFEEGASLRDYACTLLAAVVGTDGSTFLQIGDGAIVIGEAGRYDPVFWPTQGEYANTTVFVTDERHPDALQFLHRVETAEDIAVFTDGLQSLALRFDAKKAHSPFFQPLFSRLAEEAIGESFDLKRELSDWLTSPT